MAAVSTLFSLLTENIVDLRIVKVNQYTLYMHSHKVNLDVL